MTDKNESDVMNSSAEGTGMSEANYLDTHYEAAREAYEESARYVGFQKGWSILDAGAGGGSFIPLISQLLGAEGKITALDLDAENMTIVEQRQAAGEFACPVETHVGGVTDLPFDDNTFDAIWCAAVQEYLSDDEFTACLNEFKRVVRPGGLIAIKDYDPSGSIRGLDSARSTRLTEAEANIPAIAKQVHAFKRMIQLPLLFEEQGIEPVRYKTFVADHRYPVTPAQRPFLESYTVFVGWMASQLELPENDASYWVRWGNPEADDYILNSSDFYTREAHGVAIGRKPA